MTRRVVVTGVGLVCALGIGTEESWKNLVAGQSGVGVITQFDTTGFDCKIAGEIKNFDEADLEPLSYMLMSMRTYLAQRYAYANGSVRAPDAQIVRTYVKLVRFGLYAG